MASTYTTTTTDTVNGILSGKVYRFVYVAVNAFGDSDYSNELIAGVGAVPPAPINPL